MWLEADFQIRLRGKSKDPATGAAGDPPCLGRNEEGWMVSWTSLPDPGPRKIALPPRSYLNTEIIHLGILTGTALLSLDSIWVTDRQTDRQGQ